MTRVPNFFTGDSFSDIEMTNAVVSMPKKDRQLASLIPWNISTSHLPWVAMDLIDGGVRVVPSVPRNGKPSLRQRNRASTTFLEIPGYAEMDTLMNSSFLGLREAGSTNQRTIEGERNKSLAQMNDDLDETEEHQKAKALNGIIEDIDGNVIVDIFDKLGQEQTEVDLDFTVNTEEIDDQLMQIKQIAEDKLRGQKAERYLLLQGRNDSNVTLKQRAVKEQANDPTNNLLQRQDNRKGVRIVNDVDIVAYSGSHIDADESYFIPIFDDCARTIYGPSELDDYIGNVLNRYVYSEPVRGRGLEIEVWSYFLNFFTHPEAVLKVNVTA